MIRSLLILILSLQIFVHLYAQNLVRNPSFELLDTCYTSCEGGGEPGYHFSAINWHNPTLGTPDILTPCNLYSGVENVYTCSPYWAPLNWQGYQQARTGLSFAGYGVAVVNNDLTLYGHGGEYFTGELNVPLEKGRYCVGFYLSQGATKYYKYILGLNNDLYANCNKIGLNFTNSLPFNNTIEPIVLEPSITFIPESGSFFSDTLNWIKVSKPYSAEGGETYFTIGNFFAEDEIQFEIVTDFSKNQLDSFFHQGICYQYIDDVEVIKIPELEAAVKNPIIISGKTTSIYTTTLAEGYSWYANDTLNFIGGGDSIVVSPLTSTTYYLKANQCKLITWDSVTVVVKPKPIIPINILIYNNISPDNFKINYSGDNRVELEGELFNSVGQIVKIFKITGSVDVAINDLAAGVYYCRLRNGDIPVLIEKIVKVN